MKFGRTIFDIQEQTDKIEQHFTCSRLTTTDMGRKLGAVPPFGGGGAGSPFNTVALAEAYLHTKWHLSTCGNLATTDMDEKLGSVPLWGGKL